MYKNILVPIDPANIEIGCAGLLAAKQLASPQSEITILAVLEAPAPYYTPEISGEFEHSILVQTQKELEQLASENEVGANVVVVCGHASAEIVERQLSHDYDLIAITSHMPHSKDYLLGSTGVEVVRKAKCPIFVVR